VVRVLGYRFRGPGFGSRRYQIFWEVVGLERGPLSLVSTIEELLGRKSSGSCLENREYCRRDQSRWPRDTHYPQKFALTSPISGGRSVGIVLSWTQATEFLFRSFVEAGAWGFPTPVYIPRYAFAALRTRKAWFLFFRFLNIKIGRWIESVQERTVHFVLLQSLRRMRLLKPKANWSHLSDLLFSDVPISTLLTRFHE
jgi:hypothetical protein